MHQPNYAPWLGYVHNPCGRDILEGLAAGKPVISIGRYDRFVETGVTGVLLAEYSAGAFADALVGLEPDRSLGKRLGSAARRARVRRFIFISTVSGNVGRKRERCLWVEHAHRRGSLLEDFGRILGRFETWGLARRAAAYSALNVFVENARSGLGIVIDQPQTRFSPTFIDDVADAVALLIGSGPLSSRIYNLAVAETPTYREVAERVRAMAGSNSAIVCPPSPRRRNRILDVAWIRSEVGTVPQPLDVHLRRLAERHAQADA